MDGKPHCPGGTLDSATGCNPGGVGPFADPLPANVPTDPDSYSCSLAVRLQPALDRARGTLHRLGMRPYRVWLVWRERELGREWVERLRLELFPVKVSGMSNLELRVEPRGNQAEGVITLREVSPAQVDEWTLRGYLDGEPWASTNTNRQFFYELQQDRRCPNDPEPRRYRFALAAVPQNRAEAFGWVISLTDQLVPLTPDGQDQSLPVEPLGSRQVVLR